ncbi:MAG: hypothetical protein HZC02_00455 [Candidatus Levybacteria bacterium]|nr:hypothetical protein [Candidatus Levybacteria bacterium]
MEIRKPNPAFEVHEYGQELRQILGENLPSHSFLLQYRPNKNWFYYEYEGIHGMRHITRVLILQELLASLTERARSMLLNREALRFAAITHDLRRQSDLADESHGQRAGIWIKEHLQDLCDSKTLEMTAELNTRHNDGIKLPFEEFPELALFKDADALDRCRFGERSYTKLNERALRTEESKTLIIPAKAIYLLSEAKVREGVDHFEAPLDAAAELGLIS